LKNLFLVVDEQQRHIIIKDMIIELLRKRIKTSSKSLNQIGRETGIDKAALSRIMQGGSCKVETVEILLKYFGFEVVHKKTKARKGRDRNR
jgi:DNA-binding phage protein